MTKKIEDDIGKPITCKLCGKQGVLSIGFPSSVGLVHKHYCPVKAKRVRDKKNKEIQRRIDDLVAQYDKNGCFNISNFDFYGELFNKFPYKEVGYFDDISEAEKLYRQKYKEVEKMYYDYLVEKRKIPTDKRVSIFISKVSNEENCSKSD